MNQTTDLYRTQQVMFNYFLVSALAVLFLAVCHAPAQFVENCKEEFYMALELVRGLSANSYVSKRLWRTVGMLKEVGPRIGLKVRSGNEGYLQPQGQQEQDQQGQQQQSIRRRSTSTTATAVSAPQQQQHPRSFDAEEDAHSSAAVAMAGLAGHAVDGWTFATNTHNNGGGPHHHHHLNGHGGPQDISSVQQVAAESISLTQESPNGMANDLVSLFEAAGGHHVGLNNGFETGLGAGGGAGDGSQHIFGNEDELARILRELF